ncbi:hypothetical protein OAA60_06635 [Porticoccaceae bacterium]|nr:hypothetical protein [Porticoccaceae bacterium]
MSVASVAQLLAEQGGGGGGSVNDIIAGSGITVSDDGFGDYTITSNIRSALYKTTTSPFLTFNNNTVYSHQFEFTNFNVSTLNTVVNITFAPATGISAGTIVDPYTLPIWEVLGIGLTNSGTTGIITVQFIATFLSGGTDLSGLVSLGVMVMNN